MPAWRVEAGSVRASMNVMSACWASLVQIFVPVDHPVLAVADGGGLQRGEVGPRTRARRTPAPRLGAGDDRWQEPLLLGLGAEVQDGRADEDLAPAGGCTGTPASASSSVRITASIADSPWPPYSIGQVGQLQPVRCSIVFHSAAKR